MDLKALNLNNKVVENVSTQLILECSNFCFNAPYKTDYMTKYEQSCIAKCVELKSTLLPLGTFALKDYYRNKSTS